MDFPCCCCGVVGALVNLYLCSGCRHDVVASALTFHPPQPPSYDIVDVVDSQSGVEGNTLLNKKTLTVDNEMVGPLYPFPKDLITVDRVSTANSNINIIHFGSSISDAATIIFSHGNAVDAGYMFSHCAMLAHTLSLNIVNWDYTGYGPSLKKFTPSEGATYKDIDIVYNWLCERKGLLQKEKSKLFLLGQSVGSGPSCYLAERLSVSGAPPAGLILISGLTSGIRVITPSKMLNCWDIFPNIERIPNVNAPTLIIHGDCDDEVPFEHGRHLHAAVQEKFRFSPWWVPGKGHNDIFDGNETEYVRRIGDFVLRATR